MSNSALLHSSKVFPLTSLSFALALVGCGGGNDIGSRDTVDSIQPRPDLGVVKDNQGSSNSSSTNGSSSSTSGSTINDEKEPTFFLQKIISEPTSIEFKEDEATEFVVTVKAVQKDTAGAMANKAVTLAVSDSQLTGVTIEGESTQTTDTQGYAKYTLKLNPNAVTDKSKLLKDGIKLTATAPKQSGGVETQTLTVRVSEAGNVTSAKVSDLIVNTTIQSSTLGDNDKINVTGDDVTVKVQVKQPKGAAVQDVEVVLNLSEKAKGVTITGGNRQSTDKEGVATFTVKVDRNLKPEARAELVKKGIMYFVTVTEKNGDSRKQDAIWTVVEPESKYQLSFDNSSKVLLPSSGGITQVSFRVSDKHGGAISGQSVIASLPDEFKGLVVVDSASEQITNDTGIVTYTVRIPQNLSTSDRNKLESKKAFALKALVKEASGAMSDVTSSPIKIIPASSAESDVNLNVIPSTQNVSAKGDVFTITVNAAKKDGSAAIDKNVQLNINNTNGISIQGGNKQKTNDNGVVEFTIELSKGLSKAQRDELVKSGIPYEVILTENNGTQVAEPASGKLNVVEADVDSISLEAQVIGDLNLNGGKVQVQVIAKDLDNNVVSGQQVALSLPANIAKQGIILDSNQVQTTNNSGVATFTIVAPGGLTQEQKNALNGSFRVGLAASDSNGNYARQIATISTIVPTASQEVLTLGANKVVNTTGDTFKVFAQIMDKDKNAVSGTDVKLSVIEPLKTGVSITGNNVVSTNSSGIAEFNLKLDAGANIDKALLEQGIRVKATAIAKNGVKLEQEYIVSVDTTTIDSYVIMKATDKTDLNTGGDQTNLTFRIVDSRGGVLSGVPVQLSIDDPEKSGAALTVNSLVQSNEQGIVEAGVVLGAGSVDARLNHDITIRAKVVTPEYDASGNATPKTRAETDVILHAIGTMIDISASKVNLQSSDKVTLSAKIIDAAGRPISNADIKWVNSNGDLITNKATAKTDKQGMASIEVSESELTFDNGNLRVFVEASGQQGTQSTKDEDKSITLIQVSQAGISFANIENIYDVNQAHTINIQIRDDNPQTNLVGKKVKIETTLGKFENNDVIITKTIDSGMVQGNVVTVPVTLTSAQAGTAVLTAEVVGQQNASGEPLVTTVDTRFRATTPSKLLFEAVKSVIKPGGSTELVAIVKDSNDVPVEGVTVVFSRDRDSSAGRLSAATAITNAKGEAKVTYQANASSPINGVQFHAKLLNTSFGIAQETVNITVSDEAAYMTLAFSSKLDKTSDEIYYLLPASIAVMDGTGRPVTNKEVSLKSFATYYAQGLVCSVEQTVNYQGAKTTNSEGKEIVPNPEVFTVKKPETFKSKWIKTEDTNLNYILDKNEDGNSTAQIAPNGILETINPITILGGTLADDKYTFVTDEEGKIDFTIRYPKNYATWTQIQLDASTLLNGSENVQSFNVGLPVLVDDLTLENDRIITPYRNNASPFGVGNQVCINKLSISVDENQKSGNKSIVTGSVLGMSNSVSSQVFVNGVSKGSSTIALDNPTFMYSFAEALSKGSLVEVSAGSSSLSLVVKTKRD